MFINNNIRRLLILSLAIFLTIISSNSVYANTPELQIGSPQQKNSQSNLSQKSILIVGSEQNFPPFATGMTDEEASGYTVELWKAVAEEMGLNYQIRVLPFHHLIDEFKAGEIDVLLNFNVIDEAHDYANFSVPHAVFTGGIFVRNDEVSINKEADLNGKSIIMMEGDIESSFATSRGWENQLVLVHNAEDGMRLLSSGEHDAMLINKVVGLETIRMLKITNIKALKEKAGFTQKFAFAVRKGEAQLLEKINEGLAITKADGTFDTIYQKWLGVYSERDISIQDVLKHLSPIAIIFLIVLAYLTYKTRAAENKANNLVRASEAHLKKLLGTIPDLIWLKDTNGQYLYCNPKFEKYFGVKETDLVGKTDYDFLEEILADYFRENDERALFLNKPVLNEEWITSADGYRGLFETIKTPMQDINGKLLGVLGIARDIRERYENQKKLEFISQRTQHLLELNNFSEKLTEKEFMQHGLELVEKITSSQVAFIHFVKNDETVIEPVTWSRKTLEHYCQAAIDSDYPVSKVGMCSDAIRNRKAIVSSDSNCAYQCGLPKGESQLLRWISVPVIENDKVVMLTIVGNKETEYTATDLESAQLISNDIWHLVQRRRSERDNQISATVFESQEGMMITDANNIILRVNSAFTKITGYGADEVVGHNPSFISSGRQSGDFYTTMWQSLNDTGVWAGEIWNRRKNGEIYPEYLTITAVKDAEGKVSNFVGTFTDITLNKTNAEQIKNLAFYDPLTQLPNRRLLLDRLNQALTASIRSGQQGALLFMDLDHFKTLNDSLGHESGDLLLQQVAARLTACVREIDTVSRIGGDEFVLLLEDLGEEAIEAATYTENVSKKILLALSQPYQLNKHIYKNTASIGATLFNGQEENPFELLKQADIAMYQSKAEGRNTLRFYDPKMQEAIDTRIRIEQDLRDAVEQNQFELHYQIQVDDTGQAMGAEALIRWQHPERGMISPFNFIPLAEESGLILPIGQWVLDTACAQLKMWEQDKLTQQLTLSINVSAKQLYQTDFVAQVQSALMRHAVNPNRLNLELTESMLLIDVSTIIDKMKILRDIGVQFELDDFGTGYSSLQYLKMLPISRLKIDQSFVRDINLDENDKSIITTIIRLAQTLNIDVIAEGVETEDQRQFLFDNGCRHYQGYLLGKPMPVDMFEALLAQ